MILVQPKRMALAVTERKLGAEAYSTAANFLKP